MRVKNREVNLFINKSLYELRVIYMIPVLMLPLINELSVGWLVLHCFVLVSFLIIFYIEYCLPIFEVNKEKEIVFFRVVEKKNYFNGFLKYDALSSLKTKINFSDIASYSIYNDRLIFNTTSNIGLFFGLALNGK